MDKDQLDGLLAFAQVAEKRSFTAAAEALRISPSAVSKLVRQLEARVGATLLTRTTRATSLTEAGTRFLAQVAPALDAISAAIEEVGSLGSNLAGRLRLNVPQLIYPNFLKGAVASFVEKYPEVTVELFFENAATNIFERGFDAGIRVSDILAQDMVAIELQGSTRWCVSGSPGYLSRYGYPEHPSDLHAHNCICVGSGDRVYDRWEFEEDGKEFEVQVRGSLIMNDATLALDAAVDGHGLIYSSENAMADRVAKGDLVVVLPQYASHSAGIYLYFPTRKVHPKLRAFIEHITDSLASSSV